jgi:Domain of unknown function (DUF4440)
MPNLNDDFFRNLEIERTRAIIRCDMVGIERLHAPEYELVTPRGDTFSKARYIAAIAKEPFYTSWEHGPMQVRRSPDMAIVRYTANITFFSGRDLHCWHTDTYELRDDMWLAVWSQATEIAKPA